MKKLDDLQHKTTNEFIAIVNSLVNSLEELEKKSSTT